MFAKFSTSSRVVSGSTREINNTTGFWAAFRVPLSPLPILCFFCWWLQLSTLNHALFSDCPFHWMLNSVWLFLPLFAVCFPAVEKMWYLAGASLDVGLILVSGCLLAHSAYVFLACCGVTALDSLIVCCDWQSLPVSSSYHIQEILHVSLL